MLVYLLLVLGTLCFLYLLATKNHNYWKRRNVVTPKPLPLFGNIKRAACRQEYFGDDIKEIYKQFPNEKIVGFYRMTAPTLLVRDLDIVKAIMIKDFDLFTDRGMEFSKVGLGENMFHAEGDNWKVLRSCFSPLFSSGKIKNMTYLVAEHADRHVENIKQQVVDTPEIEILQMTRNYTVSVIAATAFGMDLQINDDIFKTLAKLDKLIFQVNFAFELDNLFPGTMKILHTALFPKEIEMFFNDLVSTVIKQRNGEPIGRNDVMDIILAMRKEKEISTTRGDNKTATLTITDTLIGAQAFLFFIAGYETSGTTTTFLLYEMAVNPHIQEKVIAEIDRELEKTNGEVTYDTVVGMTYLGKVFDETLRMHPIAESHAVQRTALVDYKIPGMDVTIPKGMLVLVSPAGIHYDEKYYPNPEIFDPERFSPEKVKERHFCANLSFGVGPRNCIGQRFARIQVLTFIIKLFAKFRVEPCKTTPLKKDLKYNPERLVRSPNGNLHLRFVPRQ